ncbi:MAG: hypothetical protein SGPRY_006681 [Prymnesium sp.]
MGAAASQPSNAQFHDAEIEDLRAAFDLIAEPGDQPILSSQSFADFPPILPWRAFVNAVTNADDSHWTHDPGWPGFLALLTNMCKSSKYDQLQSVSKLYIDVNSNMLSAKALGQLLTDAFVASRLGEEAPPDSAKYLEAAAADATLGMPAVNISDWMLWANKQLPAIATVQSTFLLQFLCALGRAAKKGRQAALKEAATDRTVLAAMRGLQPPELQSMVNTDEGILLTPAAAWLVSISIVALEPREYRCIYTSASHGLGMNRYMHHATGYGGASLLIASTNTGEVFGAFIDTPVKPATKFFGGRDCFLFRLTPTFHVFRSTPKSSNFCFYSPKATGQLRGEEYNTEQLDILGFGGNTSRFRMSFESDLHVLRWFNSCAAYETHPSSDGQLSQGERKVQVLEVYGCAGQQGEKVLQELQQRRLSDAQRAGRLSRDSSRRQVLGENSDRDKFIMETAGAHTFYSDTLEKIPIVTPSEA